MTVLLIVLVKSLPVRESEQVVVSEAEEAIGVLMQAKRLHPVPQLWRVQSKVSEFIRGEGENCQSFEQRYSRTSHPRALSWPADPAKGVLEGVEEVGVPPADVDGGDGGGGRAGTAHQGQGVGAHLLSPGGRGGGVPWGAHDTAAAAAAAAGIGEGLPLSHGGSQALGATDPQRRRNMLLLLLLLLLEERAGVVELVVRGRLRRQTANSDAADAADAAEDVGGSPHASTAAAVVADGDLRQRRVWLRLRLRRGRGRGARMRLVLPDEVGQ